MIKEILINIYHEKKTLQILPFFDSDFSAGDTINPKTGYPAYTNMLSASVFSESCFLADAYATSFMAMGFEKSKKLLDQLKEIEVFLIYYDDKGNVNKYLSDGIKEKINLLD